MREKRKRKKQAVAQCAVSCGRATHLRAFPPPIAGRLSSARVTVARFSAPPLAVRWGSGGEMLRIGGGEVGGAVLMLRLTPGTAAWFPFNCSRTGAICWIVEESRRRLPDNTRVPHTSL